MPQYELYHTSTQEVHQTDIELSEQEVTLRNNLLREQCSPLRYVPQFERAPQDCTCGAEYRFECVCA